MPVTNVSLRRRGFDYSGIHATAAAAAAAEGENDNKRLIAIITSYNLNSHNFSAILARRECAAHDAA
jgi:hypothetical protein